MRTLTILTVFAIFFAVCVNAYPAPEPMSADEVKEFLQKNSGKLMEGLKKGGKFLTEQFNKLKNSVGKAKQREARRINDDFEDREARQADIKTSANSDYIVIEIPKPQVHYYAAEVQKENEAAAPAA